MRRLPDDVQMNFYNPLTGETSNVKLQENYRKFAQATRKQATERHAKVRTYQNKELDKDNIKHIVPANVVLYNDMMVFKTLFEGTYFGGRTLLASNRVSHVVKKIKRKTGLGAPNLSTAVLRQNLLNRMEDRLFLSPD